MTDPTERFSTRAENYLRYRPDYPESAIEVFRAQFPLKTGAPIADIGSGTGFLSRHLLKMGFRVIGVEPDREMRGASEKELEDYALFQSWNGRAEETGLPDNFVEAITVGQALHWFDLSAARREFLRIIKPGGGLFLIWNDRKVESSDFQRQFESLLVEFGLNYQERVHKGPSLNDIQQLFGHRSVASRVFRHRQTCNWEQLKGRLLSASYIPDVEDETYPVMLERLGQIFEAHAEDGTVTFLYDTRVFYGKLR